MTFQTIPAAASAIKEMLAADQAASSQQIYDIISHYLRVRDSVAVEPIENELAAIFEGGVDHAASVVAGLESLPRTVCGAHAPQQGTHVFADSRSRIRTAFRDNRPRRSTNRIGVPVKP